MFTRTPETPRLWFWHHGTDRFGGQNGQIYRICVPGTGAHVVPARRVYGCKLLVDVNTQTRRRPQRHALASCPKRLGVHHLPLPPAQPAVSAQPPVTVTDYASAPHRTDARRRTQPREALPTGTSPRHHHIPRSTTAQAPAACTTYAARAKAVAAVLHCTTALYCAALYYCTVLHCPALRH